MQVEGRVQLSLARALVYYTLIGANVIVFARVFKIVWPYRRALASLAREHWQWVATGLAVR